MVNYFQYKHGAMVIAVIYWIIAMTACRQKQDTATINHSAISKTIESTLIDYHKAIHDNGLLGELPYLDSTAQFYWIPPGYRTAIDYDSVVTILKQNAALFSSITHRMDTLSVQAISEDHATYYLILSSEMVDTTGKTLRTKLAESGNMIRRASGWKLLCGHTSVIE